MRRSELSRLLGIEKASWTKVIWEPTIRAAFSSVAFCFTKRLIYRALRDGKLEALTKLLQAFVCYCIEIVLSIINHIPTYFGVIIVSRNNRYNWAVVVPSGLRTTILEWGIVECIGGGIEQLNFDRAAAPA